MRLIARFETYINSKKIRIPYLIVIIGLALMPLIHYSWIISMIACFFIKEKEIY